MNSRHAGVCQSVRACAAADGDEIPGSGSFEGGESDDGVDFAKEPTKSNIQERRV